MKRALIPTADLLAALDLFEQIFCDEPDAAFSLGTITNQTHAIDPWGPGVSVIVHMPNGVGFGKDRQSFLKAMEQAIKIAQQQAQRIGQG